jgi:hypothetical protein
MVDQLIWWNSCCLTDEDWAALWTTSFEPQKSMDLLPKSTAKQQKTTAFTTQQFN